MKTKKEKVFKEGCTYQLKEKYVKVNDEFNDTYRNDWSYHWCVQSVTESFFVNDLNGGEVVVGVNYPVNQRHRKYYKRVK